jgi:hypothetical protein
MAQIDFPNSPTDGQMFYAPNGATYQWLAAKTLWRSNSMPGLAPPPTRLVAAGGTINMLPGDYEVIVQPGGATTVILPASAQFGTLARVSDSGGGTAITIKAYAGGTINGAATLSLAYAYQTTLLRSFGGNNWGILQ